MLTSMLLLIACSNSNPDSLQSWAYYLVTWNNDVYQMTDEVITEKGQNYYIKDVETRDSIAVLDNGTYFKANKTISLT